ncbi:hypothetical protein CEP53_012102 [Fusarium sp. AF-6]|nr:hypothetical protein CEP53_012102 [Fusarium sp. AF-6]
MGSTKKDKASACEDAIKDRRIRKRELDRKTQRMARERTKNRITHLEAVVKQGDTDSRVSSLMDHLSRVTDERGKLLSAMESLSFVIRSHTQDATGETDRSVSSSTVENSPILPAQSHDTAGISSFLDTHAPSIPPTVTFMDLLDPQLLLDTELGLPAFGTGLGSGDSSDDFLSDPYTSQEITIMSTLSGTLTWEMPSQGDVIVPLAPPECSCSTSGNTNLWRAANEALTRSCWDTRLEPEMGDVNFEDTVIRAITEGWESVESRGTMMESWYRLRKVDDIPSQTLPHSRAIEFFAWPGLRERFVFFQHQYCANLFWYMLLSNFKFLWPFDFRDTYMQNSETGQFYLSPQFKRCMGDLGSWTMGQGFFEQFPDLYADIQIYAAS